MKVLNNEEIVSVIGGSDDTYDKMHELGETVREIYDDIVEWFEETF